MSGSHFPPPPSGEAYLLTPGPLTTSLAVREAMLRDWGSWDDDFRAMTREIRQRLLALVETDQCAYDCVPVQGSGSYAVEAMLGSFVPKDGRVLVLANGVYGLRAARTLEYLGRSLHLLDLGDYRPPSGADVSTILESDPDITHVLAVHCETSSGILNPIEDIAEATRNAGRKLLIDSMSAFGALPLDPRTLGCTAFASSANKCLEGVPGFGFVIAVKEEIESAKGNSHSLVLDVQDQWATMERTGQWRFTPPTHAVAAFLEALRSHEAEGGVAARGVRYARNRDVLVNGMRGLGFETLLADRWLSPIIVTFLCPEDPAFAFTRFYDEMKRQGFIIYPGKMTALETFRIGCIGQIDGNTMLQVVQAAEEALSTMGVAGAAPPAATLEECRKHMC